MADAPSNEVLLDMHKRMVRIRIFEDSTSGIIEVYRGGVRTLISY